MKPKRLKRIKLTRRSHYHVVSRIAERRFYLGRNERNVFCDMMVRVARFSGVKVLTYCIMDNHFHLLIEIPERKALSLKDVKQRLALIYHGKDLMRVSQEFERWEKAGNTLMVEELKQQYERRMFDLSEFMKTLKQRFAIWYNRNHEYRKGTLWEEDRFVSVLVQSPQKERDDTENMAILTIAAYIELNPVRAGIVDDPKDYRWSGYGAAMAGFTFARKGLQLLIEALGDKTKSWLVTSTLYRKRLLVQDSKSSDVPQDAMRDIRNNEGGLLRLQLRHCRIPHLSTGIVIGTKSFVADVVAKNNECFHPGSARKLSRLPGRDNECLCVGEKRR